MYRKIVVGYDGSAQGDDALAFAGTVAEPGDTELVIVNVFQFDPFYDRIAGGQLGAGLRGEAEERLARSEVPAGLSAERRAVAAGSVPRGLHDLARSEQADLIVVGSTHHSGVGRALVGHVAERLLHGSPCAVAVAPKGYRSTRGTPRGIGVAFDGSPESCAALEHAVRVAAGTGATLYLIRALSLPVVPGPYIGMVPDTGKWLDDLRVEAARETTRVMAGLPAGVRAESVTEAGLPAAVISARVAENDLDMVFCGSRGYGPVGQVLLGSVSAELAHNARVPVVVVPRGEAATEAGDALAGEAVPAG